MLHAQSSAFYSAEHTGKGGAEMIPVLAIGVICIMICIGHFGFYTCLVIIDFFINLLKR